MGKRKRPAGENDGTTGQGTEDLNVAGGVPISSDAIGRGSGELDSSPTTATKPKKPREVRYYLTGLGDDSQRVIIGEFGTISQLHRYCDPLWGAITRGLRDVYIIKGKVYNEGP